MTYNVLSGTLSLYTTTATSNTIACDNNDDDGSYHNRRNHNHNGVVAYIYLCIWCSCSMVYCTLPYLYLRGGQPKPPNAEAMYVQ